jgi:hypothetical protein
MKIYNYLIDNNPIIFGEIIFRLIKFCINIDHENNIENIVFFQKSV